MGSLSAGEMRESANINGNSMLFKTRTLNILYRDIIQFRVLSTSRSRKAHCLIFYTIFTIPSNERQD